jgi:hypothetical protein
LDTLTELLRRARALNRRATITDGRRAIAGWAARGKIKNRSGECTQTRRNVGAGIKDWKIIARMLSG